MPQSKKQTGKLNEKSKPISTLYLDPSHKQGHTKTQNKGMEEDLSTKWRAKINKQINKKQELQFSPLIK